MKKIFLLVIFTFPIGTFVHAQIDSTLIRRTQTDTSKLLMNMDAVYNRPFLSLGKTPVAVGGYVEANWQHLGTDGVTDVTSFK